MFAVRMERYPVLQGLALWSLAVAVLGLADSRLAPGPNNAADMSVPAAVMCAVFAAHVAVAHRPGLLRGLAAALTALVGAVSAMSLLVAPLAPGLDRIAALIEAATLRDHGFHGSVDTGLDMVGLLGASALLSWKHAPSIAVLATLLLVLCTKVAVIDGILSGGLPRDGLSIWTLLCTWSLEFALMLLLKRGTMFSCLFMQGRPGTVMRWMVGTIALVPIVAGVIFHGLAAEPRVRQHEIAVLCALLGWGMLLIALAFGHYLKSIIEQLEETGRRDPLTRLLNRHGMYEQLRRWRSAYQGVILCDLDRFKAINDRFGHEQGDRVLRGAADALAVALKTEGALLARWGGEEFLILLREGRPRALREIAERCRHAVSSMPDEILSGMDGQVPSASFGCAILPPGEQGLERAIQAADLSLYSAKVAGRNRVVVSTPEEPKPASERVTTA